MRMKIRSSGAQGETDRFGEDRKTGKKNVVGKIISLIKKKNVARHDVPGRGNLEKVPR